MPQRVILRTVLPAADRADLLPLYLDGTAGVMPVLQGRHTLRLQPDARASLLSYFNGFPAAYWQHATAVETVRVEVRTSGPGTVTLCASDSDGRRRTVVTAEVRGDGCTRTFHLPLEGFGTGGWYWLELQAGGEPLILESAEWSAADVDAPRSLSVVVTTHNRPEFCIRLLRTLSSDETVAAVIDRIFVIDQGTAKVRDQAAYADAAAAHGDRLVLIDQDNVGGSGGFSRGMVELLRRGESGYLLLLDDDIDLEPEAVARALQFARFAASPTIVGGHMLDLNAPLTLHAFGEVVDRRTFNWGPPDPEHRRHDFAVAGLAETGWLHRRADVDFNGWWMCLLPRDVLTSTGLSMPYFIKWDDAEYGLRARRDGVPTISLPGAAVWHVSWLDKDDSRDWQSYFHSRNRMISALLHSPAALGGTLLAESFGLDLKHLLFMQYYAVRLRHEALRDLLQGPAVLEQTLRSRLPWAREVAAGYDEMKPVRDSEPPSDPEQRDPRTSAPRPTGIRLPWWLLRNVTRHFTGVRNGRETPPVRLTRAQARWWRVPSFDAVQVPLADGSGSAVYRRDASRFRNGLASSVWLHARVLVSWRRLRRRYRAAAWDLTSQAAWERYLALSPTAGLPVSVPDVAGKPAVASSREIRSS